MTGRRERNRNIEKEERERSNISVGKSGSKVQIDNSIVRNRTAGACCVYVGANTDKKKGVERLNELIGRTFTYS